MALSQLVTRRKGREIPEMTAESPENPADNSRNTVNTSTKPKRTALWIPQKVKDDVENLKVDLIVQSHMDTNLHQLVAAMVIVCRENLPMLAEARKRIEK